MENKVLSPLTGQLEAVNAATQGPTPADDYAVKPILQHSVWSVAILQTAVLVVSQIYPAATHVA